MHLIDPVKGCGNFGQSFWNQLKTPPMGRVVGHCGLEEEASMRGGGGTPYTSSHRCAELVMGEETIYLAFLEMVASAKISKKLLSC